MSAAEILGPAPAPLALKRILSQTQTPGVVMLPHCQLQPSPLNPRKKARPAGAIEDLAEGIATFGVLQNLVARKRKGSDKYELAAGEGRWLAVKHLIASKRATDAYLMPVSVRELSDEDVIEIGLCENGKRNDLDPLDEARGFLALWERRVKDSGRKGAGDVLKDLSHKTGCTPRYVQLRLRMARNLTPKAGELLDKGTINIAIATELSAHGEDQQRAFFSNVRHDDLERMTARDVRDHFKRRWRAMAGAIFDPGAYSGSLETIEDALYATDTKLFDRLQKASADKLKADCIAAVRAKKMSFFIEDQYFHESDFSVRLKDGKPDPQAGVVIQRSQWRDEIKIFRGLVKKPHKIAEEKRNAEYARAAAVNRGRGKAKAAKADPRLALLTDQLRVSPAATMAVSIFNAIAARGIQVHWLPGGTYLSDPQRREVDLALQKLRGSTAPTGLPLLKWLLSKTVAQLAPVWCALEMSDTRGRAPGKPTQAELLLFAHCGVKTPPAAKPTTKKKGKAK